MISKMLLVRGDVCVSSYFAVCLCVIFTHFNRLLQNQLGQIQPNCPKYFIVKVSKLYPYTNNNRAYTLISCKKKAKEQYFMHVLILVSISTVVNLFCVSICILIWDPPIFTNQRSLNRGAPQNK